MSLTKTIDVWCDYPECFEWTHGETAIKPSASRARKNATRGAGFVSRRMAGNLWDFCAEHADATMEDIRAAQEATAGA